MQTFAIRLKPNQDLKPSLKEFAQIHQLQAGCVLSAIGSLKTATLRFADQPTSTVLTGRFEILSLQGTLSVNGLHLHLAIADATGQTIGGHIDSGCIIYTTAEIIVGELSHVRFCRTLDLQTGCLELDIQPR
ncbi:MAG TPA: PPC domain-containing DNA-binding protein [Microcoleaceae cyanobacterium]|jgi:predicted DNA-binding protein with PD1-like motif